MTGSSHPKALLTFVRNALGKVRDPAGPTALSVAVSGGADSMALLHCCILLREQLQLQLLAVAVDHGLRPEAQAEVRQVAEFCGARAVDFVACRLQLPAGGNVHARAREARYRALWASAHAKLGAAAFLATAHHKDDRAETVLLRLLRGTSLEGLSVLPPQTERLLRPLSMARRADVELHVARHHIPYVSDPSNADPRYLRSRVRHELLPLLVELGPGIVEHLTHLADEAQQLPEPLGLSHEHRQQLRLALRDIKRPVDVRLSGGLRLVRAPETDPK
ncbi:MAG TPA: tRNA lysidine(34) synthetase TilS [Polyangiaceae bacterium]|nr:tRNA lysidine(34) synthetase TilS [Polyangiaceae bacterium]